MALLKAWNETFSTKETNEIALQLAKLHCSRITEQTVRERAADLIDRGDLLGLCDLDPAYAEVSVNDALQLRQIQAFFGKRGDLELGIDTEAAARLRFKEAEAACRETNALFECAAAGLIKIVPRVEQILVSARRKIAHILGDVPSLADVTARFGPGATTTVPKRWASWKRKLSAELSCSRSFVNVLTDALESLPAWVSYQCSDSGYYEVDSDESDAIVEDPELAFGLSKQCVREFWETATVPVSVVPGRLAFVPKSYKTKRSIVVEPVLNSMFQLGVGDVIASRLKAVTGVDIHDQTRNQRAAREGSLNAGSLDAPATIDLSSASDTISDSLVRDLIPIDWYILLDSLRSTEVADKGDILKLQKFSSMGNGFTFPLETLLFYVLAECSTEHARSQVFPDLTGPLPNGSVLAYGDDLVVPEYAVSQLKETLAVCGFTVNYEKSFSGSTPFRESCGKDYFRGIDIRPVYLRDRIDGATLFRLHNHYAANYDEDGCKLVLSYIAPHVRVWGPMAYSDIGHLWTSSPPLAKRSAHAARGFGGWTFDTYAWKARRDSKPAPGDYVFPVYSTYIGGGTGSGDPRYYVHHDGSKQTRVNSSRSFLRDFALSTREPIAYSNPNGVPACGLPGVKGFHKISIYTYG